MTRNLKKILMVFKTKELRAHNVRLVYLSRLTLSDIRSGPQWQCDSE